MESIKREELEIQEIKANITKMLSETNKINHDLKYDWLRILLYGIATFSAATFLILKMNNIN